MEQVPTRASLEFLEYEQQRGKFQALVYTIQTTSFIHQLPSLFRQNTLHHQTQHKTPIVPIETITNMAATFWDPKVVLDVDPWSKEFTCTTLVNPKKEAGQPRKPRRRCQQRMFLNDDKRDASLILETFAHIDVVSDGIPAIMKGRGVALAALTACPHSHKLPRRSQADAVGAMWAADIMAFPTRERAEKLRDQAVQVPVGPIRQVPVVRLAPARPAPKAIADVSNSLCTSIRSLTLLATNSRMSWLIQYLQLALHRKDLLSSSLLSASSQSLRVL